MCSCIGTQKWVHERCLREWQQTQIQQALHHRAKMCEVGGGFGARQAHCWHALCRVWLWATAAQGCAEGLGCGIEELS